MLKKPLKILIFIIIIGMFSTSVNADSKELSKSVKVGDKVYFGKYEQDGDKSNGKEKIEWRVIDRQGDKVLLVTDKLLDGGIPYNKEYEKITTWHKSTVSRWLNRIFINEAFSNKEKKKIQDTIVENKGNEDFGTYGGANTTDKLFLLSVDEVYRYFKSDEDRGAALTKYARIKIASHMYGDDDGEILYKVGSWRQWCYILRSPGDSQDSVANVGDDGSVSEYGNSAYHNFFAVRPAMWVSL